MGSVWLCAALGLACAAAPAAAQTFAGTAEVVEVEVPVQVVRDGQPVRGLTAADFEIYDGRKKQAITGFHAVDLATAGAAASPLAGRRQFLLFFDLAFSDPQAIVKAREAARELVLKGARAGDLVGVATYSAARGPQLVLGFTSDRRQVDSALASLGLARGEAGDPLRLVVARGGAADRRQLAEHSLEESTADNDALLSVLGPQQANLGRESNRAAQTAAVTALTRSVAGFAHLLAAIPGRKQVLYFSEGFDSSLLTGSGGASALGASGGGSISAGGEDPTATVDRGIGSSEPVLGSTDESFGSTHSVNEVERMLEELRRADCVVQAVDIGGLRAGGEQRVTRTGGKDTLVTLARGTDGELFENSNDLSTAMSGILERTSLTYVLSFQPENVKPDGAYHKLRVELRNSPRGTRLSYRSGYYSPKPYASLNPLEKLFEASSRVMGGVESGSISTSVLAAPFRTAAERAYVPVLIEVDGPALLAGKPQGTLPVEIYVYALDAGGAIQDFLVQSLGLDLAKAEPALRQSGLKFFGHLDLPAGEHSVRTLVRNGATGAYSLRVVPLTVPSFAAGPVLLPPFFPEPANRWLLSRETPRGPQPPYPFMARQQPYIPSSRPALAAGQEVPLSLVGYNLGPGELKAEGRILTRDGREAGSGEVRVVERESAGAGPDRLEAVFKPPKLAPGEYLLRVTLTGAAGAVTASGAPFAVSAGR
ncbi:MAG TPA: VWA domain-containing protein [Thermoanaerobaculia bacterium]